MSTGQCQCYKNLYGAQESGHYCSLGHCLQEHKVSSGQQPWSGRPFSVAWGYGLSTYSEKQKKTTNIQVCLGSEDLTNSKGSSASRAIKTLMSITSYLHIIYVLKGMGFTHEYKKELHNPILWLTF